MARPAREEMITTLGSAALRNCGTKAAVMKYAPLMLTGVSRVSLHRRMRSLTRVGVVEVITVARELWNDLGQSSRETHSSTLQRSFSTWSAGKSAGVPQPFIRSEPTVVVVLDGVSPRAPNTGVVDQHIDLRTDVSRCTANTDQKSSRPPRA